MKIRICPHCGRGYTEPPALSRADNATDICPDCGMEEALEAIPMDIRPEIHISPCPTCGAEFCFGRRRYAAHEH